MGEIPNITGGCGSSLVMVSVIAFAMEEIVLKEVITKQFLIH